VRGEGGYEDGSESSHGRSVPRLRVLDLQVKAFSLQRERRGGKAKQVSRSWINMLKMPLSKKKKDEVPGGDGCVLPATFAVACLFSLRQVQMRRCPKPIVASVAGYAIGGGHILHMVCDITLAADNAVFGQTGPRVGSFDAG